MALVENRQNAILSQIEDKYEKPVSKMYNDTRAIVQNMVRAWRKAED